MASADDSTVTYPAVLFEVFIFFSGISRHHSNESTFTYCMGFADSLILGTYHGPKRKC